MYYSWQLVLIMHTLTCIFSKWMDSLTNMKYKSIPLSSNTHWCGFDDKKTIALGYDKIRGNEWYLWIASSITIQVIYRKSNTRNKQHMPFRKCSSFDCKFFLPLPLAGKQDFEFSNTSCFLQFIPYTHGSMRKHKNNYSKQMYYWWKLVLIMHTLACIF